MTFIKFKHKKDTQSYYTKSHVWSDDVYSHAVVWRNWALVIALVSLCIATLTLVGLFKLLPLKGNTPFLVFVDHKKGEPVSIRPIASDDFIENDHLKKYMIRKFIVARQRYNPNTINDDAKIVSLLSSESVYTEYQHAVSRNNPISPVNSYKNNILDVGKVNISFLNEQRAYISFVLLVNAEGIVKELPMSAQIKFHFAQKEMPLDEAYMINPVNFEVLSYQSHYQVTSEEFL
jgi:type IV secretion system protein VirB8